LLSAIMHLNRNRFYMASTPRFAIEDRFTKIAMVFSFLLLTLGSLFGLIQVLSRLPGVSPPVDPNTYYIGLTLHGTANAVLFTAYFIMALAVFVVSRELNINFNKALLCGACVMAIVGTLMAAVAILLGQATVLYTFYPPMIGSPLFYFGLAILLLGTWVFGAALFEAFIRWRRANRDKEIPLGTFGVLVDIMIWLYATPPLVYLVLFRLIPASLFGTPIDILEARFLFWYFGHPLVYFWLVPAVTIWYALLPRLLGTEIFDKRMAKLAFILYMMASTPVGLHHQYVDPGISPAFKYMHASMTYLVALPSFLTAFNVIATLEKAGRMRGGGGLLGWLKALPWNEKTVESAAFVAITLAIVAFGIGGFSGVVNASFNLNYVVHNTMFVVTHFHAIVGTAVSLTFLATSLLLMKLLMGKELPVSPTVFKFGAALWVIGVIIFNVFGYAAGITGEPRRTYAPPYVTADLGVDFVGKDAMLMFSAIYLSGGLAFWIGGAIVLGLVWITLLFGRRIAMSGGEVQLSPELERATIFDRFGMWVLIGVILILAFYTPPALQLYGGGLATVPPQPP